jgi:hypothetical protein
MTTTTLASGQSYVFTNAPFSVDATPTSSVYTSGPMGGSLPPPDITGYTYGDYATPNYNYPGAAATPNVVPTQLNPVTPAGATSPPSVDYGTWLPVVIVGGLLVGVIFLGHTFDKKKGRKK